MITLVSRTGNVNVHPRNENSSVPTIKLTENSVVHIVATKANQTRIEVFVLREVIVTKEMMETFFSESRR